MLFSSLTFLLYFLPAVALIHYFLPRKAQNPFLLLSSLLFYAWGDIRRVPLFAGLLIADWGLGLLIGKTERPQKRRLWLILGLLCSFGALLFYKYTAFLLGIVGVRLRMAQEMKLPLGISFFTFQAAGYLIDVYRGKAAPEKDPVAFGTFLFLFPQLIAGPIVRYQDLQKALHQKRRPDAQALDGGMSLFALGLGAKVLLANPLGAMYTELSAFSGDMACAWLSLIAYSLQIYFDFMGYSVMAVGMGRMLGFSFPRNFRHPYAARSVTDFWRRWHITLSAWFRDYVYIPLGGSRRGAGRTAVNLLCVWLLTGFWHGADWTFILWGLWYFVWLAAEKFLLRGREIRPAFLGRALTLLCVFLGWALFVSDGLADFGAYAQSLFCFRSGAGALFWAREYALLLLVSAVLCVPKAVEGVKGLARRYPALRFLLVIALIALSVASLAKSTFNPFLYFRF
ncbi:MAG: MBOAT family protein [Clostridia bacterium]|nr:MBOAT family protein [Clostridia bacterium]